MRPASPESSGRLASWVEEKEDTEEASSSAEPNQLDVVDVLFLRGRGGKCLPGNSVRSRLWRLTNSPYLLPMWNSSWSSRRTRIRNSYQAVSKRSKVTCLKRLLTAWGWYRTVRLTEVTRTAATFTSQVLIELPSGILTSKPFSLAPRSTTSISENWMRSSYPDAVGTPETIISSTSFSHLRANFRRFVSSNRSSEDETCLFAKDSRNYKQKRPSISVRCCCADCAHE